MRELSLLSDWRRLLTMCFSLLLDHMRKFPVSATGGLMLAK
jgi:hypothetical protein